MEKNLMTFEEFVQCVEAEIRDWLPGRYNNADIKIQTICRRGCEYTGLIVTCGEHHSVPIINLEEAYQSYQDGDDWDDLLRRMALIALESPLVTDVDWIAQYANVKDSLFLRICNKEDNENMLSDMPVLVVEDLALTCHVLLESNTRGICSAPVNRGLAERWGTEDERLFDDAFRSGAALFPPRFDAMDRMLYKWRPMIPSERSCSDFEGALNSLLATEMMVISNRQMLDGAAALFYPGVMEQAARIMKGGYYVLPSSVHELILLPDVFISDYRNLEQIVRRVNRLQVAPEDRLSDRVYHYDDSVKRFERAEYFEGRKAVSKMMN